MDYIFVFYVNKCQSIGIGPFIFWGSRFTSSSRRKSFDISTGEELPEVLESTLNAQIVQVFMESSVTIRKMELSHKPPAREGTF